jgi:hypothetical protein
MLSLTAANTLHLRVSTLLGRGNDLEVGWPGKGRETCRHHREMESVNDTLSPLCGFVQGLHCSQSPPELSAYVPQAPSLPPRKSRKIALIS